MDPPQHPGRSIDIEPRIIIGYSLLIFVALFLMIGAFILLRQVKKKREGIFGPAKKRRAGT
jgi:hypothetical protein